MKNELFFMKHFEITQVQYERNYDNLHPTDIITNTFLTLTIFGCKILMYGGGCCTHGPQNNTAGNMAKWGGNLQTLNHERLLCEPSLKDKGHF